MARIPRYFASPGVTAGTVGVELNPELMASFSQTRGSVENAQAPGKIMQQVGSMISDMENEELQKSQSHYMGTKLTDFQLQAIDTYDQMKTQAASNPENFAANTAQWFNNQKASIISSAPDEASAEKMMNSLNRLQATYMSDAHNFERKQVTTNRLAEVDQVSGKLLNRIQTHPEEYPVIQQQLEHVMSSLNAQGVDPTVAAAKKQELLTQSQILQAQTLAERDPVGQLEKLTSGEYNHLPPESLRRIIGQTSVSVAKIYKEEAKATEKMVLANIYFSGSALDPKNADHKKAADAAYEELTRSLQGKNLSDQEYLGQIHDFVKRGSGVLAPELNSAIRSNILNGSPENKAKFSGLLVNLSKDPKTARALDQVGQDVVDEAVIINSMVTSGTSPEEAAKSARNIMAPPAEGIQKQRAVKLKDRDLLDLNDEETVRGHLEEKFGEVENLDAAVDMYKTFYKDSYMKRGQEDLAKESALRKLDTSLSVSKINGTEEIMAYAPERLLGQEKTYDFVGQINRLLSEQFADKSPETQSQKPFNERLLEATPGNQPTQEIFNNLDVEFKGYIKPIIIEGKERKIKLKSLATTNKDFGYGLEYEVELQNGDTIDVPLLHPETGLPVKITPDVNKRDPAVEKELEMLKQAREDQNNKYKTTKGDHLTKLKASGFDKGFLDYITSLWDNE